MRQHRGRAGVRGDRVIEAGLGLVVGIVIGSLGGGGGIVTVPVLVYLLSMEPVVATTASLVIVGIASLASLAAHARHGVVRWRAGLVFGVGLVVSGMTRPDKVQGFLDVAGDWDPSLAFVMAAAIPVVASRAPANSGAPVLGSAASTEKPLPAAGVPADQLWASSTRVLPSVMDAIVP